VNDTFEYQGTTASGAPFYSNGDGEYLYYEPDCDGNGSKAEWTFDRDSPNTDATEDLDGDGGCFGHAYTVSSQLTGPPSGAWQVWCDGSWQSMDVTFTMAWVAWALVGEGKFCADVLGRKRLSGDLTVSQCHSAVQADPDCGTYLYSNGISCHCLPPGATCDMRSSEKGNNVYQYQAPTRSPTSSTTPLATTAAEASTTGTAIALELSSGRSACLALPALIVTAAAGVQ
jgi:hypothetical protein